MKFVDRSNEIAALEREYQRDGASMVILYGRRRVGKTELIRHFILMWQKTHCLYRREMNATSAEFTQVIEVDNRT